MARLYRLCLAIMAVAAFAGLPFVARAQGLGLKRYRDHALHADGTTLYCGFRQHLVLLDTKDLENPVILARVSVGHDITSIKPCRGYLLVGTMGGGIAVYDTADVSRIWQVSLFSELSDIYGMDVRGTSVSVASGVRGFAELDAADIKNLRVSAIVNTPGEACDVVWCDGRMLVADGPGGLHVAERGTADPWTIRHSVETKDASLRVAVAGGSLVLLSDRTSLRLFEFGDEPTLLRETGAYRSQRLSAVFADLRPEGPLAYIAAHMGGLEVVDCSRPASPQLAFACPVKSEAAAVAVDDGRAYVLLKNGDILLFDVSDSRPATQLAIINIEQLPILPVERP
jgi:hypothetical protein